MTGSKSKIAVLLGALGLVAVMSAGADGPAGPHFTFTVPLQLANLPPEIRQYEVQCAVSTASGPEWYIVSGNTRRDIVGGAVNTEVVVPVTVGRFQDPGRAVEYSCHLFLHGVLEGTSWVFMDDAHTVFPLAAGAPSRRYVRGTLPR